MKCIFCNENNQKKLFQLFNNNKNIYYHKKCLIWSDFIIKDITKKPSPNYLLKHIMKCKNEICKYCLKNGASIKCGFKGYLLIILL